MSSKTPLAIRGDRGMHSGGGTATLTARNAMQGLLNGIRILDLTRMLAGPYGTMLLGDLGADVIKIEDFSGDYTRLLDAYYLSINRNKRSFVLDIKSPEGKRVFFDLVKVSDVVIDNMRPNALRKLGFDYDDIKVHNPGIISCSLSGYGHTGPYRDKPAFDLSIQAISGGMSLTGEKGGPPVKMGIPIADIAGGMFAAFAVVSALVNRNATGEGRKLDISMLDSQISMASYLAAYYLINGTVAGPQGARHESIVPYEAFRTRDRWIVVACVTPKFWESLCRTLGTAELLSDERFSDPAKRLENRDDLAARIQDAFLSKTTDEWLALLERAGVPCAPVNALDHALNDPQVLARDMVLEFEHPRLNRIRVAGNPVKSPGFNMPKRRPPELGEHTEEVLKEFLNYSDDTIAMLETQKTIASRKEPMS
ncbi:MAG: CoA transferase [Desulfobacterales bacterium]